MTTAPASDCDPAAAPILAASGIWVSFATGSALTARLRHRDRMLRAVDGVDLDIQRGEALALVGESGSGKSTLAMALAGLHPADRGEIRLDGRPLPARRSHADQRRIQMIFQDPYSSLNLRLTVGGMLRELIRVHHVVPRDQVTSFSNELIDTVGLGADALAAHPRQFSGGQRQRVAIARALALRPDILLADEPVSALDLSVQATILNLLRSLRHDLGMTLLLISHNLAVVRHLCDRVAVMYLGRIVEVAPTETLFRRRRTPTPAACWPLSRGSPLPPTANPRPLRVIRPARCGSQPDAGSALAARWPSPGVSKQIPP